MGLSFDVYQVLLMLLVGIGSSYPTNTFKLWTYQLVCMVFTNPSYELKLILTTGLLLFMYLECIVVPLQKYLLIVTYVLICYIVCIINVYSYNYTIYEWLYDSDIDLYLEYITILLIVDYKELITNARDNKNKFKYNMFNTCRSISMEIKKVKKGEKWGH